MLYNCYCVVGTTAPCRCYTETVKLVVFLFNGISSDRELCNVIFAIGHVSIRKAADRAVGIIYISTVYIIPLNLRLAVEDCKLNACLLLGSKLIMVSSEGLLNDKVALVLIIVVVKSDCEGIRCSAIRIRDIQICRSTTTDNNGRIIFRISRNHRQMSAFRRKLRRYGHIGSTCVVSNFTGDSLHHLILS